MRQSSAYTGGRLARLVSAFPGRHVLIALSAIVVLPATLAGQRIRRPPEGGPGFLFQAPRFTIGVRGAFNLRTTGDSIYDDLTNQLTLNKSDFNAFSVAGDLGVMVSGPVDLVLSGGYTRTSTASEFRDWVDQNDLPITQQTTLSTTPVTLAARVHLTARGRQVGRFVWVPARLTPYVGAGVGMVRYRLEQEGSFVDFTDLTVFDDRLTSRGWTVLGMAMAGADYALGTRLSVNADVRYSLANATLRQDFASYTDGIDLGGLEFSLGLKVHLSASRLE